MFAAKKPQPHAPSNGIEQLQSLLAEDLQSVNAEIVRRMQSPVDLIPQLAAHLIAAGGKRLRPLLTLATSRLCGYGGSDHIYLAAAVECIHTATLLHDDVVDESFLRRGQDTANAIWGNKSSVLVGDFLFSRSFQLMVESKSLDVLRVLSDASATIAEGEVHQLLTANNLQTTEEDYRKVIGAKTAALFAASCEIGGMIAESDHKTIAALREYGLHLGFAFQISDDAFDFTGLPGKQAGDDFRDGKITLPVILAFAQGSADEKKFWQRCLEQQDVRDGDFENAVKIISHYGCIEQCLKAAEDHGGKAKQALNNFVTSPILNALLDTADFAARR